MNPTEAQNLADEIKRRAEELSRIISKAPLESASWKKIAVRGDTLINELRRSFAIQRTIPQLPRNFYV